MGLNGIDISSWQEDLVVSAMGTCDFVIVKATGGAGYSNECFRRHADETLASGKLLGCYHYARDRGYEGSAEAEADHFISAFKPYVGKAIPFLDCEADALNLGPAWVSIGCFFSHFSYLWGPSIRNRLSIYEASQPTRGRVASETPT